MLYFFSSLIDIIFNLFFLYCGFYFEYFEVGVVDKGELLLCVFVRGCRVNGKDRRLYNELFYNGSL